MTLIEEAQSLMLHQFAQSHRLKNLLKALVRPFQEVLDSASALNHGHYIDDASEATLDVIGSIVGQSRDGMSDDDFKAWIKVRILLNKNGGTPEDLFEILSVLYGSKPNISMEEKRPNIVVFTFFEYPRCPTTALLSISRSALPLTIACKFIRAVPPTSKAVIEGAKNSPPRKAFQLDVTAFSESYFADFHEEDKS